jgi:ectoine hydroxylase-related dioxygenase (phytanoyl-CoA dioxygenase family)
MDTKEFDLAMQTRGWVLIESVVDLTLLEHISADMQRAYERCREIQLRNGVLTDTTGTAHHIVGNRDGFDDFLRQRYLVSFVERYLGGKCILNSYGAFSNQRRDGGYFNDIHRDVGTYTPNFPLMVNMLVMIDDFNIPNGATYMLSGSHHDVERPSESFFFKHAERLVGPCGSIAIWDARVWHAAGKNSTDVARRALTLTFTRPFVKQQLDYPRFVSAAYVASLDEDMRQLLGFNARTPSNLEEWYQPRDKRLYRPDQG